MKTVQAGFVGVIGAAIGLLGCGGPPVDGVTAALSGPPLPRPIASGDYFPDSPHHHAGIINQFYPAQPFALGDGPLAEPNEITDFNGWVFQVFQSGSAVDNHGNQYFADTDNRVFVGEYIGADGRHGFGAFCEI